MRKQKDRYVICGMTVHSWLVNHGKSRKGSGQFNRTETHPCYLRKNHSGPHRCWTEDSNHETIVPIQQR